jgi:NADH-quinone oxidoreductase subunit E
MLPQKLLDTLRDKISQAEHPPELVIEVMMALQNHYGYLSDEGLEEGADLLGMDPLELEELATFYDFIFRQPVGKYVIQVCDSIVCWMLGQPSIIQDLGQKLGISPGETTGDGLFTLIPVCCLGHCDQGPAMMINGKLYGPLNPERIDQILKELREEAKKVGER